MSIFSIWGHYHRAPGCPIDTEEENDGKIIALA